MFSPELLYKIAVMYYQEKLIQEEIARKVGISRPMVSRALDRALEQGIVRIEVVPPKGTKAINSELEAALGLQKVVIAPSMNFTGNENEDRLNDVAEFGAKFLEQEITSNSIVGFGWGKTVYRTVMNLQQRKVPLESTIVIPLVGSLGRTESHFQVNIIVNTAAAKLGGSPYFYNVASLLAGGEKERDSIQKEYSDVFSAWKHLDAAIISIGASGEKPSFPVDDYSQQELEQLSEENAIGDVLGRFFNEDGFIDFKSTGENSVYVGVPSEDLQRTRKRICLVSGKAKIDGVMAGSKLGLFNILVIDEKTAGELAERLREKK